MWTHFTDIFDSKFTLPNNPSKFTRCLRETKRTCGRLPLMTIFITTSLSSQINIYRHDCWTLVRLVERDQWFFVVWEFWDFNRREGSHCARQDVLTRQSQNPRTLWYHFRFNAAQQHWRLFLTLVQMYDHQIYKPLHQMLSTSATKSASWNRPSLHSLALSPTWQNCRCAEMHLKKTLQSRQRFGTRSVPFRDNSN